MHDAYISINVIEPEVTPPENLEPLKWRKPDIDGLVQFLVHEKSFSEERVRKAADRLVSSKDKANQRTSASGWLCIHTYIIMPQNVWRTFLVRARSFLLPSARNQRSKAGKNPRDLPAKRGKLAVLARSSC